MPGWSLHVAVLLGRIHKSLILALHPFSLLSCHSSTFTLLEFSIRLKRSKYQKDQNGKQRKLEEIFVLIASFPPWVPDDPPGTNFLFPPRSFLRLDPLVEVPGSSPIRMIDPPSGKDKRTQLLLRSSGGLQLPPRNGSWIYMHSRFSLINGQNQPDHGSGAHPSW